MARSPKPVGEGGHSEALPAGEPGVRLAWSTRAGPGPEPTPLFREAEAGAPYPIEVLPPTLRDGVLGIVGQVQCPPALAAQSTLAAASLVAQAHVNVRTLGGSPAPASLFLVTVAASGERKSSADGLAMRPAVDHEARLRRTYATDAESHQVALDAWEAAHRRALKTRGDPEAIAAAIRALGPKPIAPMKPIILCGEPTVEGLWSLLLEGPGFAGVMSAEGGAFFGGHAMARETKLRSAATLSEIWDGAPIRRVRRGDGASVLVGRRVAVHLLAQVETSRAFLADRVLADQGLLSRLLVAAPPSAMGTRLYREPAPEEAAALGRYHARLDDLFEIPPARGVEDPRALAPRTLEFDAEGRRALIAFADAVEAELRPDGKLRSVSGHAAKLPEHAARIAAVFTWIHDPAAEIVPAEIAHGAIDLANWYAGEALRLFGAGEVAPDVANAEALRVWLLDRWRRPSVRARDIVRLGPNALRTAAAAKAALGVLAEHGWVQLARDARGDLWRVAAPSGEAA